MLEHMLWSAAGSREAELKLFGKVEPIEDTFKFIRAIVCDHQLSFTGGLVLNPHTCAQGFAETVLQTKNVRIDASVAFLLFRLLQPAHEVFRIPN